MSPRSLDDLSGEIRDHIERETHDNIDRGMAPDEARRAARLAFGNVATTQEDVRAVWIPVWLEHVLQDIRYALRSVRRNPIFSAIVVATLTIGIGLSTTVLAPFDSILLRPLDYPDSERLVSISITNPDLPPDQDIATNQEYWAFHDRPSRSLDKLLAYNSYDQTLSDGSGSSRVRVALVTDDFWTIASARAVAGRLPAADERNVVVLSEQLYATAFASTPSVIGHVVTLDSVPVTVIGVMSRGLRFQLPVPERPGQPSRNIDLYRSFAVSPPNPKFAQLLSIVGRLRPDVDLASARAELTGIRVARPFSRNDALTSIRLERTADRLVHRARLALNVLLAAVSFVLFIACANIANLLLARATVRQKEIAVRVSVGAGRARVLRQFLFESSIYAVLGGTAGLLLGRWSLAAIIRIYPHAVPRLEESTIHASVIAVLFGVLMAITAIFGLIPAIAVQHGDLHAVLKDGARTGTASPRRLRARTVLAVAQLALAVALLTGAGLMAKSFWRMNDLPAGFAPDRILTMRIDFPPGTTNRAKRDYATRVLTRLKTLPGVEALSLNTHGDSLTRLDVDGAPESSPATPRVYENQVSAEFARVMGLQLLKGRWITDDEPVPVVVLNETLAKLKFGRQDPIGQRVKGPDFGEPSETTGREPDLDEAATVVGVVADLRYSKLDEDRTPELYTPYAKTPGIFRLALVIKTAGDPRTIVPSVRTALTEVDRALTPFDVTPLDQALIDSIAPRRLNLVMLVIFASTAMLLALIGIYGVMSYSVSQRTHEIGIRSALGAARTDLVGMVVWQGLRVAAVGIAIGVAGALALTRVMTSLLFQVEPTDPPTFVSAATVLALAAILASAVPAIKAGAVDPLVALRYE